MAVSVGNSVTDEERDMFMGSIKEGLVESGKYEVLENRKYFQMQVAEELKFQDDGWTDDDSKLDFGDVKNADYSCQAKIFKSGNDYKIFCDLNDLFSGGCIGSFSVRTKNGDLMTASDEMTKALLAGKGAKPKLPPVCPQCCKDPDDDEFVDGYISLRNEAPAKQSEAIAFCKSKGDGWYLPNRAELAKIYKNQSQIADNDFKKFQRKDYWSSSSPNDYEGYSVNFGDGSVDHYNKNERNAFRCIRQK
ncbi:hypothetical protein AGMMS49982_20020 [Bacteroidia bacterium]|nr:hypothetical protein AGMMS49982_20020 [Bacteroidia bacterium]